VVAVIAPARPEVSSILEGFLSCGLWS